MFTTYKENLIFINNLNENSVFKVDKNKFILDSSYLLWLYSSSTNNVDDIILLIKQSFIHYLIIYKIEPSVISYLELLRKSLIGIKNLKNNKNFLEKDKDKIDKLHQTLEKLLDEIIDIKDINMENKSEKPKSSGFFINIYQHILEVSCVVYYYFFSRFF